MASEIQNLGEIVIFNGEDGNVRVQVDAVNETIWLNRQGIAEVFGVSPQNISYHLGNIFVANELEEATACKEILLPVQSGVRGLSETKIKFYNLDAIIAVGYRVNSKRATAFRMWATKILKEYMVKGFALDDDRMKKGKSLTYFEELERRIREIRLSERIFYQKVKDIYALSVDYDANDERTIAFFKKVQNKLLWAVSGKTAAELVYYRANANLPQMGLTSTETKGKVLISDIDTGKNYLNEEEINSLKLLVEQYLSFAEFQAHARRPMYMKDWEINLDMILTMNQKEILAGPGKIQAALAKKKVRQVYLEYKEKEKEKEHLESIRELDAALKEAKTHKP